MRTRTKSIVTALVLLSLVSGAVGCRSNGGPWYNPTTYSFQNPFKSSEDVIDPYVQDGMANSKPSLGSQPNVNTPPGGYTDKTAEARFNAGSNQKAVSTQYGFGSGNLADPKDGQDNSRVANSEMPGDSSSGGFATSDPYSPYGNPPAGMPGAQPVATEYQQTKYQQGYGMDQPTVYPATGVQSAFQPNMQPEMQQPAPGYGQGYGSVAPAGYAEQPAGYSPYGVPAGQQVPPMTQQPPAMAQPAPTTTQAYGPPATAPGVNPVYSNAPTNYGVPAATPQNPDPAGYGAGYGTGYSANPSSYPPTY